MGRWKNRLEEEPRRARRWNAQGEFWLGVPGMGVGSNRSGESSGGGSVRVLDELVVGRLGPLQVLVDRDRGRGSRMPAR